jgi:hypothetical protein
MRRWWTLFAAIVVAIAWCRGSRTASPSRDVPVRTRRVDATRFRAALVEQLTRAREVAARGDASTAEPTGRFMGLTEPCLLGPAETCAVLAPLIDGCDGGEDARDCLAVGDYIATTPPRAMAGWVFFLRACELGDAEACARADQIKHPGGQPCADDPYVCAFRAVRNRDRHELDHACALGVSDACAFLNLWGDKEALLSRALLETECQLGAANACGALAMRLEPDCDRAVAEQCYAPDPAQAREARAIACAAGWTFAGCSDAR